MSFKEPHPAFGVLSLVLGVAYLYFKTVFFWGEYLLKVVLGVVLITLLFILSSKRTLGNRVADYLGDISYEVYLSHGFTPNCLRVYLFFQL